MTEPETPDEKTTGWRGSREGWLAAARQALIENGIEAVKIQPLATGLGLSRTSFYWFFKDRNALLEALLDDWESRNTGAFLRAAEAYAETICEAMLNLIAAFQDETAFAPRLDFAVRGWAHRSETVQALVNAADETRLGAIRDMFLRFDFPAEEADVRARAVYLTQIGYIAMQVQEDLPTRVARVPGYVKTFCGEAPTPAELARFHARLGIRPQS